MKVSIILFLVIKCIFHCNVSCLHQLNYEQFAKRLYQHDPPRPLFAPPSQANHLPGDNIYIIPPRTHLKPSLERNDKLYSGYPRSPSDYTMDYLKNKYFNLNCAARRNELTQADNEKTRDWMSQHLDTRNVVTVPPNCPSGQPDQNGNCREVWPLRTPPPPSIKESAKQSELTQADKEKIRNWISQQLDTLNVVTVPPICPSGQLDGNGYCRDVWPQRTPSPRSQESSGQFRSAETTTYVDWGNMTK